MAKGNRESKKPKQSKLAFSKISTQNILPDIDILIKQVPYKSIHPIFSFKYYDHSDKLFSAKKIDEIKEFHALFKRLNELSSLTWHQIEQNGKYHAHEIRDWQKTSRKLGFSKLNSKTNQFPPYQFGLSYTWIFRIIGFFEGPIFYVIWLDCKHKLCPFK